MFTNEDLYELAIKKIDAIANESDELVAVVHLSDLITGRFNQALRSEQNGPHHYDLVVRALNDYFKEYPESKINDIFEKALHDASTNSTALYAVSNLGGTIICQLDMEKMGKASIDIDDHQALLDLKQIQQRAAEYKNNNEMTEEEYNDVMNYFAKADAYLQKHHGKSIK